MVRVAALAGVIEGNKEGKAYSVIPRIKRMQAKVPIRFLECIAVSYDAIPVVGLYVLMHMIGLKIPKLELETWCGRRDSNPGSRLFPMRMGSRCHRPGYPPTSHPLGMPALDHGRQPNPGES